MYKLIVNNGLTLLDEGYCDLIFYFNTFEETMKFIKDVFKYGDGYSVEIIQINESGD